MTDEALLDLILNTVRQLAEDFDIAALADPQPTSVLFGSDGALDSMALVNLLADLESAVEASTGQPIILADEKAMSAGRSPFRTPLTLRDAIRERLTPAAPPA